MWGGVCWLVAALQSPVQPTGQQDQTLPAPTLRHGPRHSPGQRPAVGLLPRESRSPPPAGERRTAPLGAAARSRPGATPAAVGWATTSAPPWAVCQAFPGRLSLWDSGSPDWSLPGITSAESQLPWVTLQIQRLFQHILGHLDGYLGSSARDLKWPSSEVTLFHHFSARAPVTSRQVAEAVATFRAQCHESSHMGAPACALLRKAGPYQSLSLCLFDVCDSLSTSCSFQDGLVRCTCQPGHFQAHPADRTCAECSSGFWLQNGTCTRCPFGFGGAGCQEPFLLALVVVSGLAGLLLLLLIAGSLSRSTRPPKEDLKETPDAPQLPLHASSTLSLPRVRPPWTLEEAEMRRGDRLSLWGPDVGQRPANAPRLKTFLGSSSSLPSPPQPLGGCHNLVFVSDAAEEKDRRSFF
ncbi:uncharacterized protein LOC128424021 isoform X3 [Podarcis raffonei]|uniref:uncharacterized protein LOC128424021 isoform X3 n=1 Tax=Podarcis raffonei TaxID=65483 RepID=UPI0023294EB7|nr:uncharacterized protein LOC128424021 isoform X3 [Podarcis raffonei]